MTLIAFLGQNVRQGFCLAKKLVNRIVRRFHTRRIQEFRAPKPTNKNLAGDGHTLRRSSSWKRAGKLVCGRSSLSVFRTVQTGLFSQKNPCFFGVFASHQSTRLSPDSQRSRSTFLGSKRLVSGHLKQAFPTRFSNPFPGSISRPDNPRNRLIFSRSNILFTVTNDPLRSMRNSACLSANSQTASSPI